jgi:hypothetical protein
MKISYNRIKSQGKQVEFPSDENATPRIAYGHNGVGRLALFCFADYYVIETWKNGKVNIFDIARAADSAVFPFKITSHKTVLKDGHGTKLTVNITRNAPKTYDISDVVAARFIFDPMFDVLVNGIKVNMFEVNNIYSEQVLQLDGDAADVKLKITIIDTSRAARKLEQNGIAFWIQKRLVGQPDWQYGEYTYLDRRYHIAKRFTIIIQTEDLIGEVKSDWSGFKISEKMNSVYKQLKKVVDDFVKSQMIDIIENVRDSVIQGCSEELRKLDVLDQREISEMLNVVTGSITPRTQEYAAEFTTTAVQAIANVKIAEKGGKLLSQISKLTSDEINKLSDLLSEWSIYDILKIIKEIDSRLITIDSIQKLHTDKTADELHILHPLILDSRWLFGEDFDSPMYTSNVALSTVIKTLF